MDPSCQCMVQEDIFTYPQQNRKNENNGRSLKPNLFSRSSIVRFLPLLLFVLQIVFKVFYLATQTICLFLLEGETRGAVCKYMKSRSIGSTHLV